MKFLTSYLLALAAAPAALAEGEGPGDPPPQAWANVCYTSDDSPLVEDVEAGVEAMEKWDPNDQWCSPNADSPARMAAGDGYSFFAATTDPEAIGSYTCSDKVTRAISSIISYCAQEKEGGRRVEGAEWLDSDGIGSHTNYVFINAQSK